MKPEMTRYKIRSPIFLLLGMLFLTACVNMPHITAVNTDKVSKTIKTCETVFHKGKWQFVHLIEAALPGGRKSQLIGVTEVSSNPERIHAVMMTVEGLVLFEGLEDGNLTINRSVAPFDSIAFAEGLMGDIRLMFLKPGGQPIGAGITDNGFEVCRYRISGDAIVDVMVYPDCMLEIRKYRNKRLIQKFVAELNPVSIPEKIAFTAYEPAGYHLNLRLISAERISK